MPLGSGRVGSDNLGYGPGSGFSFEPVQTSTWAKRRRTGLLPSGPKSSFQMRASFVFHLETKVLESGGRVEKLRAKVA